MTWPFIEDAKVTQRHGDRRGNSFHRAWDVAAPMHSTIYAPEDGEILYFVINRAGEGMPLWPRGAWITEATRIMPDGLKAYPWYFSDRVGHCCVLKAKDRWWLFAHMDPRQWWLRVHEKSNLVRYDNRFGEGVPPAWKVEIHHTDEEFPVFVKEGERIGGIGNGGVSTGSHCHWECAPVGYMGGAPYRIDIATLFPER